MSDEEPKEVTATTQEETKETTAPATPPEPVPETAEKPTLDSLLEEADPKLLRSHPKIAGIIGSVIQTERERVMADEGKRAAQEAEKRLRQLAESDPVAFTEQWLSESQKKEIQDRLASMSTQARQDIATAIGRAFQDMPEWKNLSEADHEKLAKSLIGKADDEVIPVFNKNAIDLIAERRAAARFDEWKTKEMGKMRESLKQEVAAELLNKTESPDTAQPKGPPARVAVPTDDKEFEAYWNKFHKY